MQRSNTIAFLGALLVVHALGPGCSSEEPTPASSPMAESDATPDVPDEPSPVMVHAGETTVEIGGLGYSVNLGDSDWCQPGLGEGCEPTIFDICDALGPWPDTLVVAEVQELHGLISGYQCQTDRFEPPFEMTVQILAVVAGAEVPEQMRLTGYGTFLRGGHSVGDVILAPLTFTDETWFLGAELDLDLQSEDVGVATDGSTVIELPPTFEELSALGMETLDNYRPCADRWSVKSREAWEKHILTPQPPWICSADAQDQ